jgi:hypothetical protein
MGSVGQGRGMAWLLSWRGVFRQFLLTCFIHAILWYSGRRHWSRRSETAVRTQGCASTENIICLEIGGYVLSGQTLRVINDVSMPAVQLCRRALSLCIQVYVYGSWYTGICRRSTVDIMLCMSAVVLMYRYIYLLLIVPNKKKKRTNPWPESANELYRPSDRRLSAKLVPTFVDRRCHVVSVTDSYGRILDFLDLEPLLFLPSSFLVVLTRLSGPRSRPTTSQKIS